MDIRPMRSAEDHEAAMREIERLWGAKEGTPEFDKLDVLATLVEAYESKAFPIPLSDPIEILEFAISDMGRSQLELANILGSRSRASEVLARKRPLTLEMIRKIAAHWKLPEASLVRPYRLERPPPATKRGAKRRSGKRAAA